MTVEAEVEAQLPLDGAGARLLRARELAGLSRAQVSAATRIPERHLLAIEEGNFAALPARTYAVGFSRSYAKAVGADEAAIMAAVREDLAGQSLEPAHRGVPAFEPGDPGRVPSSGLAWLAALVAIGVIVAGVFFGWKSYIAPGGSLPSILADETPAPAPATAPQPATVVPGGAVVFTATAPDIWVKFSDGSGQQLMQRQLAQGESWTVPADVPGVTLWTARPEALAITIGGQPVARLSEVQQMIKDVPVSAAALLARSAPGAAPSASTAPAANAVVPVQPRARPAVRRTDTPSPEASPTAPPIAPPSAAASPAVNQAADR